MTDTTHDEAERHAEIAGRFIDEGMSPDEADAKAAAMVRADQLAPVPLADVQRIEKKRVWFWDGILTTGLAIIAAKKGQLKSWLSLRLGIALADGLSFLGKCTKKSSVLYLALELDDIAMAERARLCGEVRGRFDVLFSFRKGKDAIDDLTALVDARGYGLVIVDMLPAILPADTDGNAYDEITAFMLRLRRFAQSRSISIVCLMHSGKAERADFADAVMGSTGFAGQADTVCVLDRKRGEDVLRFMSTGNHGKDQSFKIAIGENVSMTLLDETNAEQAAGYLTGDAQRLLQVLTENYREGTSATVLSAVVGKSPGAVRVSLNRLADKGLVERVGRGLWKAKSGKPETDEGNGELKY